MHRVIWAGPALDDVDRIEDYLDGLDPRLAGRIVDDVMDVAEKLTLFPARGSLIEPGVRSIRIPRSPYRLVYRVDDGNVQILRIRHEREDWR